ncbi:MAG: lipid A biosynthesis acyltransferase [Azovibrio sp.]|uniref:LpxL/LpxP family acyltransferase n=1 Tax=Azovibrio sp. TaxID=1872673 RepID=UPI003C7882FE
MKHFFRYLPSYAGLGLLWLLHWLPLPLLRPLGAGLGRLLFLFGRERRRIGRINLALCFPQCSEAEQKRLLRRHFVVLAQSMLDRTLFWWAPRSRLERIIRIKGGEHLQRQDGRSTLILAPHFVGLDAGGVIVAMTLTTPVVSVYSRQKNPVFDAVLFAGRMRFNVPLLLSRQEGMRRVLRAMKQGIPFFYLPDMDFGPRESIFVPFFGVETATITGVSRLVRASGAKVVPCIARLVPDGYEVELHPPWENFPGESIEADTAFMNRFIESQVLTMPEQYFWLHKRFKTRPEGEPRIY